MDTLGIIKRDGYTFDDLTPENQDVIRWLRLVEADIDTFEANCLFGLDDTIIEKLQAEIAEDVIAEFRQWLACEIAEVQISLIEHQEELEEEEQEDDT